MKVSGVSGLRRSYRWMGEQDGFKLSTISLIRDLKKEREMHLVFNSSML